MLGERAAVEQELKEMFERVPLDAESRFIDVGCGLGGALAKASEHGAKLIVGADINRNNLLSAKRLAQTAHVNCHLIQADITHLPFKSSVFNRISCRLVLPYVPQKSAVGELVRILSGDGRLYLQLHSHRFYLNELRRDWFSLKRLMINGFCLFNGVVFHLTGHQLVMRIGNNSHRELFQTERGVRRLLGNVGIQILWKDNRSLFRVLGTKMGSGLALILIGLEQFPV